MKKISFSEVKPYAAPKHFDCSTLRLQGKEETGIQTFWVGMSYFLPGGGAEWAYEDNANEKVYYVLEGELKVKSKDETFVLNKGDSLYIGPNEGREVINDTNYICEVLVMITYNPPA